MQKDKKEKKIKLIVVEKIAQKLLALFVVIWIIAEFAFKIPVGQGIVTYLGKLSDLALSKYLM